ncbi:MAG TPA: endolytic transglycosylase MltG [Solirubrobacteraceae bacterium]|jgi:uncharacterized YceG family protein|nr:endolytic transglycosylase MltG [Solirubrobacteraceae bacterium]
MSPSRKGDSGGSRTAEQRERDRRERERRRARRGDVGGAGGPFDILASDIDVTVSRPPDLDWPADAPAAVNARAASEWQGGRPAPDVPAVREPHADHQPPPAPRTGPPGDARVVEDSHARHDPHGSTAPDPGYPTHPSYAPHPGYGAPNDPAAPAGNGASGGGAGRAGAGGPYDGTGQAGYGLAGHDAAQAGYGPARQDAAQAGYGAADADWPQGGYGAAGVDDARPGRGTPDEGGAAGRRGARRRVAGRLPSVSLPAGRPGLPAGLAGLGARVSGLRSSRPSDPAGSPGLEADGEAAPRARRIPGERALGRRSGAGARLPSAGERAEGRVGSLRRSLDPRTASRSILSNPRSTSRGSGQPLSRRGRIGAIAALIGVVFVLWFLFSLFQPLKGSGHGTVDVVIPAGAGTSAIGSLLAKDHVISSAFFFKLRAELSGKRGKIESGRYVLRQGMSYGAVLSALTGTAAQPAVAAVKVTIPEGDSRTEIAAIAKRAGIVGEYLAASVHSHVLKPSDYGAPASVRSLEGFLFPDTYDLLPGDPVSKLINEQLVAFKQNIANVDLTAARHLNLTTYDVVTIASMVEREAQVARERPLIAAVIYNRLKANMPLGIDATLRFALNDFDKPLTNSQLASNSPYNTRLHRGLPPTPIGNPGLASLEAAAHPAKVSYLYYVVKPGTCGEDAFSSTFAQFEQDSARYNAARNADNGRSPTTCSG